MSLIYSKSNIVSIKVTITGLKLRGPMLASWIYMKNPAADSCSYSRPVNTLQALYLVMLCSIACVMTHSDNIPLDMRFGITLIFPC